MGRDVIFTDLTRYLTRHVRQRLAAIAADSTSEFRDVAAGAYVDTKFPEDRKTKAVVIRDDGTTSTGLITEDATIGVNILVDKDHTDPEDAKQLALIVKAIIASCATAAPDNPVAIVRRINGPSRVSELSGQPRFYFTADLGVVGKAFEH